MEDQSIENRFSKYMKEKESVKAKNSRAISRDDYHKIITRLLEINSGAKKTLHDFNLLNMYEVADFDGAKILRKKGTTKRVVFNEELFEILTSAHTITGHGGRDVMHKHIQRQFHNINASQIQAFVNLCEECQLKRCRVKKSIVVKPILSSEMNSRCQVDLIDFQSQPDGPYKFIMCYQDHLTKFVCLRPLKCKTAVEVAENLIPIFCQFGAPNILHCDNGKEFANQVIKSVTKCWAECLMVHGKPRHSQSQGSVERANRDVQDKLACWLRDNKPRGWSEGLPFIQFQKNISFHSGIGRTPYEAMFGNAPKCGLKSLNLPTHVLNSLESEEQLEAQLNIPLADGTLNEDINEASVDSSNAVHTLSSVTNNTIRNPCNTCEMDVSIDEICSECSKPVHFDDRCSVSKAHGSRNSGLRFCIICENQANIAKERDEAIKFQIKQAKKMTTRSEKILQEAKVGQSVTIPVPDLDRGRGDHRNLLGVILSREKDFFRIGTQYGTLSTLYTRNQFSIVTEKFLDLNSVPDRQLSLRQAARESSTGSGQGFFKCMCSSKCQTNKCKCRRGNVLCNSKCHGSNTCCNK